MLNRNSSLALAYFVTFRNKRKVDCFMLVNFTVLGNFLLYYYLTNLAV